MGNWLSHEQERAPRITTFSQDLKKKSDKMTDEAPAAAAPAPKAAKAKKVAKPKKPATHPKTTVMVAAAIAALKDRKGSPLPAIKKYIAANYKVDVAKISPIRKAIKKLVADKKLIQTKASFKAAKEEKPKKVKKPKAKKPKAKKPKKTAAKKTPKKAKK